MRTMYLKLLRLLQRRCEHPGDAVVADILEGDAIKADTAGFCVQWCEVCGAFRFVRMHWPFLGGAAPASEWREPRPDWHTPKERKQLAADMRDAA